MPYKVEKSGQCGASKPYAVVKDDGSGTVMGCHTSQADADQQMAALYANEPAAGAAGETADFATQDGAWEGVLAVEGVETGDGREFAPGSLTWAQPPLPVSWQKQSTDGGHAGSVGVGRVDEVWRDEVNPQVIRGRGVMDMANPDGTEAYRQVGDGFLRGNSIDVDTIKEGDVEAIFPATPDGNGMADDGSGLFDLFGPPPEKVIYHAGRIRGTTLVNLPAFVEAQIWLAGKPPSSPTVMMPDMMKPDIAESPTGTGTGKPMMQPYADIASSPAASGEGDIAKSPAASGEGEGEGETEISIVASIRDSERRLATRISHSVAREIFGHVTGRPHSGTIHRSEGMFLHHSIGDGGVVGNADIDACLAAIGQLLTDAKLQLTLGERHTTYAHLARHVRDAGLVPQPFTARTMSADVRALTAGGTVIQIPPMEWFEDPHLTHPTAMTITAEGRIFGHAALFDTCHIGSQGVCINPPFESRHDYFLLGDVLTADGQTHVATGCITLGTGHAPTFGISPQQALEHYDNTGTRVADVTCGNDQFGIWVSGAVRADITPGRLAELRAAKLSGDWRRIGGHLRLIAMLAVNVPGFPVPRLSTRVASGQQLALVASGILDDVDVNEELDRLMLENGKMRAAVGAAKLSLSRRLGRGPEVRRAELRSRMHRS